MKGSQKSGLANPKVLGAAVQNILNTIQRSSEEPEKQRVRRIVEVMMRLCKCDRDDPTQIVDFIRDNDDLDALLSAYTWEVAAGFTDRLRIGFQPKGGTGWEGGAISTLVRLAESDELDRLRVCKACGRLFYAFRDDKAVCNAICKAKAYDADPEHHAARLKRLRENYKTPGAKKKRAAKKRQAR